MSKLHANAIDHDRLATLLADHLAASDRMIWTDMQLGPSGSVRPDVYTLNKSYAAPLDEADLRSEDEKNGQWLLTEGFQNECEGMCGV